MKMKSSQDPDEYICALEKMRHRMKEDFKIEVTDEDMVSKILNNLPRNYDSLIDSIHVQMNS